MPVGFVGWEERKVARLSTAVVALAALLGLGACAQRVSPAPQEAQSLPPAPTAPAQPDAPRDNRTRVAVLLPLSGSNAQLGSALLDAAQLAVFDTADESLELVARDTRGTHQGAAEAARQVTAEGARMIIGPFFSTAVQGAAPVAWTQSVPMIALTSDRSVASQGVWAFGFAPAAQVERVVGYAASQGLRRIAAMVPSNAYGNAVATAFEGAARRNGATVVRVQRFDPTAPDVRPEVQRLLGPGGGADPGFDALLIAEGGPKLREIASIAVADGMDPRRVRLLGTGLWDERDIGREPVLVGGWFAAAPPEARAGFEQRYELVYGRRPPRLATLAYDAMQLAAVLARGPEPLGFDERVLTSPEGFAGVDGIFRLLPDGSVERGLAVLEVQPEGFRVVDPAPQDFLPRQF